MFDGNGVLTLVDDHLDLSFRRPGVWPSYTPKGSIKSLAFSLGDAAAGPGVQLGLVTPIEDEPLDWKHKIDPVHHHGSDQFRLLARGEWVLAGKPMTARSYAFQESGWVYQEHPTGSSASWMLLLMADRRGTAATVKFERDRESLFVGSEEYVPATAAAPYAHPAGSKGIAAIATTRGTCHLGYLLGNLRDLEANGVGCLTGVIGDETAGPVVHLLKAGPGATVMNPCMYATELFFAAAGGSCRIGGDSYEAGDMRIQRAGASMQSITAGPAGLEAVLIVADRRCRPTATGDATLPPWVEDADRIARDLIPRPGGVGTDRLRREAPPT